MPLPPKEIWTITELAARWNISNKEVERFFWTDRLHASIYMPLRRMTTHHKNRNIHEAEFEDIFETYNEQGNKEFMTDGEIFIHFEYIEWNELDQGKLEPNIAYLYSINDKLDFSLVEPLIVNKKDIYVTIAELEEFEAKNCQLNPVETSQDIAPKMHPKEKESLLKMVIAMAIDAYGFDPAQKKSPIPNQIMGHVEMLGLTIDVDTVRKWLDKAAELLPRSEPSDD